MTLHKFVFSPTGGTKKAASFLCQNWAGKENNIDLTTGTIPRVDFEPGEILSRGTWRFLPFLFTEDGCRLPL